MPDDIFDSLPETPQHYWRSVAERLEELAQNLSDRQPDPAPVPLNGDMEKWRELWGEHDTATMEAARAWLESGELPDNPVIGFFLWIRATSAAWQARLCSIPARDALFFMPIGLYDDTILMLLGDWWREGGESDGLRRMSELQYLPRHDQPVTPWAEVLPRVEALCESLHSFSRAPTRQNTPAKAENWPKRWLPTAGKVETALECWLANGELPGDVEVAYWFGMRASAMAALVRQLADVELFQPRHESVAEIFRYFFGAWWVLKGAPMMWGASIARIAQESRGQRKKN